MKIIKTNKNVERFSMSDFNDYSFVAEVIVDNAEVEGIGVTPNGEYHHYCFSAGCMQNDHVVDITTYPKHIQEVFK